MEVFYQSIFWLSIASLAITVTVFVLAVSLLGRAVRISTQEQMIAEQKRKEYTENEIKKIKDMLDEAKARERVTVEELVKKLRDLEEQDRKHRNRIRWIKIKPKLLTANWGALVPSALFITSALLSTYATYYKDIDSSANLCALFAFISLLSGMVIVALTLKAIEGVAITSEETSFTREAEALKTAMTEAEGAKRPEVEVSFKNLKFPLEMKPESELTIRAALNLSKGDFAQDVEAYFALPSGFDFTDAKKKTTLPPDHEFPNYVYFPWEVGTLVRGIAYFNNINIKSPAAVGNYKFIYQVVGRGLSLRVTEQSIIVK